MKIGYRRVSTEEQLLDRQDLGDCDLPPARSLILM